MSSGYFWYFLIGGFILFVVIQAIGKANKPVKMAVVSVLLGIAAMLCVNLCSGFTGVSLPISDLSVSAAAVGGIPAVALMVLVNLFS